MWPISFILLGLISAISMTGRPPPMAAEARSYLSCAEATRCLASTRPSWPSVRPASPHVEPPSPGIAAEAAILVALMRPAGRFTSSSAAAKSCRAGGRKWRACCRLCCRGWVSRFGMETGERMQSPWQARMAAKVRNATDMGCSNAVVYNERAYKAEGAPHSHSTLACYR